MTSRSSLSSARPPVRAAPAAPVAPLRRTMPPVSALAPFATSQVGMGHAVSAPPPVASLPSRDLSKIYHAPNDPHLKNFYARKSTSRPSSAATAPLAARTAPGPRTTGTSTSKPTNSTSTRACTATTAPRPTTAPVTKKTTKPAKHTDRDQPCGYRIKITTGSEKGHGTNATVHSTLFGDKGQGPRTLLKNEDINFKEGSVDVFDLVAPKDLGQLTKVKLESDGLKASDSWFVDEISVKNCVDKTRTAFTAQQWLSTSEGDKKTTRTFYAHRERTTAEYEVSVETSDVRGAGTDANVFMTLVSGETGESTGKHRLHRSGGNAFERGRTDAFTLTLPDVGPLLGGKGLLRIEHDDSGPNSGWHLNRVVVVNNSSKERVYFNCNKWLSRTDGDHQIVREIVGTKDATTVVPSHVYTVTCVTGKKRGAGTDANVFIELFGEKGRSGERQLSKAGATNCFEKGNEDAFGVECARSLGKLTQVKLRHDNSGAGSAWYVEEVRVTEGAVDADGPSKGKGSASKKKKTHEWVFGCRSWLATDEGDGQIARTLIEGQESALTVKTHPYRVRTYTSDKRNAGTDANVFVELMGTEGNSSGKTMLKKNEKGMSNKFERGHIDEFIVECASLGDALTALRVGHDGRHVGAGWRLDKVEVDCPDIGKTFTFPADRWLDDEKGDGLIEVELFPTSDVREFRARLPWIATVHTADERSAGTDANVFIKLYGTKGQSDEIALRSKSDAFERNAIDHVKFESDPIGRPIKLRVWHDGTGRNAGWKLSRIVLESPKGKLYEFPCNEWLARSEGDGEIVRELPAEGDHVKEARLVDTYKVSVVTGKEKGAGTDSNVRVNIFGADKIDTGERELRKSATHRNKFERKNTDEFELKAVDLGELEKIRVSHDNSGASPGWFLDHIAVENMRTGEKAKFPCGRWLALDEDDGLIARELPAEGRGKTTTATTLYELEVVTSDVRYAGTSAKVYVQLFSDSTDTGPLRLRESLAHKSKFERNQTDRFDLKALDLGSEVRKVRLWHDGKGVGSGWHVARLVLRVPSQGKEYLFDVNRWLDEGEADGELAVELMPNEVRETERMVPWEIRVQTADERTAGTDSEITATVYGPKGHTKAMLLATKSDTFERNSESVFKVEGKDVGRPFKVRLNMRPKGIAPGWKCAGVQLVDPNTSETLAWDPHADGETRHEGVWFNGDRGDETLVHEFPLAAAPVPASARTPQSAKKGKGKSKSSESSETSTKPRPMTEYAVHVFTGDKKHAGTDSRISLVLYGAKYGDTGERVLCKSSTHKSTFRRNQEDIFTVHAVNLGTLVKARVASDASGLGAGWFCDRVEVEDLAKKKTYTFACGRWLDTEEDDGLTVRELAEADAPAEVRGGSVKYEVKVTTGDVKHASTDANCFITLFGDKGDTGKLKLRDSGTHKDKFQRGHTDVFILSAIDLGKLTKVELGHDNKGLGSDWYVESLEINVPSMGHLYKFPVAKWFAKGRDDGRLVRELFPSETQSNAFKKFDAWQVRVFTGGQRGAGTDAKVSMVAYGSKGKTREVVLETKGDAFERKGEDLIECDLEPVGALHKIRIGHDNSSASAGWFLERVEMEHVRTGAKYRFECGRWLATDEDDGECVRELPVSKFKVGTRVVAEDKKKKKSKSSKDSKEAAGDEYDGTEEPLKLALHKYQVHVMTSDVKHAATSSTITLNMFGKHGDTGERTLRKSTTHKTPFKRAQEDVFEVEAVNLGALEKVIVASDAKGLGAGWHLAKIVVDEPDQKEKVKSYSFTCDRWLDPKEDDGQTFRELVVDGSKKSGNEAGDVAYEVSVTTGTVSGATTHANVWVRLVGSRGETAQVPLKETRTKQETPFKKGRTAVFDVRAADVGSLKAVEVGHDAAGLGDGWYLEHIVVDVPSRGRTYHCDCKQWLDKGQGDRKLERTLAVQPELTKKYAPLVPHEIKVYTSDLKRAGTDSNVTVCFYGEGSLSSDVIPLKNRSDNFERGGVDRFPVLLSGELGALRKVRVSSDGKGMLAGWHLHKIIATNKVSGEKFVFPCGEWFATSEGDGRLTRELARVVDGEPVLATRTYRLSTVTGNKRGAGTDANVSVILFGSNGDSGEHKLEKSSTHRNKFERNNTDTFELELLDLGQLKKVRVWHDESGAGDTWLLDSISVEEMSSGTVTEFPCGKWLSSEKGESLVRELIASGMDTKKKKSKKKQKREQTSQYRVTLVTDARDGSGTDAIEVRVKVYGTSGNFDEPLIYRNKKGRKFGDGSETSEQTKEEIERIGSVTKVKVMVSGASEGKTGRWRIARVRVEELCSGGGVWVCSGEAGGTAKVGGGGSDADESVVLREVEVEVAPDSETNEEEEGSGEGTCVYRLDVHTGDKRGAGTNANVFVVLKGRHGDSGKRELTGKKLKNLFERDQTDHFDIECADLGTLKELTVEHDGKGMGAGWFLEDIRVTQIKGLEEVRTTVFPCHKWLDTKEGDGEIKRVLKPE